MYVALIFVVKGIWENYIHIKCFVLQFIQNFNLSLTFTSDYSHLGTVWKFLVLVNHVGCWVSINIYIMDQINLNRKTMAKNL